MKSKTEHKILFGPGGCITREAIEAYIDGHLSDDELKKLRSHARKCQLCSDSLEGAGMFSSQKSFSTRLTQMHQSRFRKNLDIEGKTRKLFYGITSAAASIALIFGVVYILKYQDIVNTPKTLAENKEVVEKEMPAVDNESKIEVSGNMPEPETETVPELKATSVQKEKLAPVPAPKANIEIEEHVVELDEQIDFKAEETALDLDLESVEMVEEKEENRAKAMSMPSELKNVDMAKTADKGAVGYVSSAPDRSTNKSAKKTFYVAEVKPMFRGGDVDNFSSFVADSLKVILPDTVLMQSVVVGFKIDTSGNVKHVKLISGTDSEILNKQIISIIENSPQWIPASVSGNPISSDQEIQVVFGK